MVITVLGCQGHRGPRPGTTDQGLNGGLQDIPPEVREKIRTYQPPGTVSTCALSTNNIMRGKGLLCSSDDPADPEVVVH